MIFALISLILLVLNLPFTFFPEFAIFPYLQSAGWVPYREIIDQHFPGLIFFPLNIFRLGFDSPFQIRIIYLCLLLLTALGLYYLSRVWFTRQIAAISFIAWCLWQPYFAQGQLWFETFLGLLGTWGYLALSLNRYFTAGLIFGLALTVKQTFILLLLPVFFWTKNLRNNWLNFLIGFLLPWLILLSYLAITQSLTDFWFWTIVFNFTHYQQAFIWPALFHSRALLIPFLLFFIISYPRFRSSSYLKIILFVILSVLPLIPRFDLPHLQLTLPFLAISAGLGWSKLKPWLRRGLLVVSVLLLSLTSLRQAKLPPYPYYSSSTISMVRAISARIPIGTTVLYIGLQPHIYALTHTYPPGRLFVYPLSWYYRLTSTRLLHAAEADPPQYVIIPQAKITDPLYDFYWPWLADNYRPGWQSSGLTFYVPR